MKYKPFQSVLLDKWFMKSFYILFIYLEEEVQAFMLQIQFYLDKLDAKKTSMVKEADEIKKIQLMCLETLRVMKN